MKNFDFCHYVKLDIEFDSIEKQDYSRSWDYTIKECNRLISCIIKCDKYATNETLSINEAQQSIQTY